MSAARTMAWPLLLAFIAAGVLSPITAESNRAVAASTLAIATLDQCSTRLRNELDIDALEGELLVVSDQTLHPSTATVWLRTAEL